MRGSILTLPREKPLKNGWSLRLLPAREAMAARREGAGLAAEGGEEALCANACLLSHALLKKGRRAFPTGQAVLDRLTAAQIARLARTWQEFDRACDPGPWDGKAVEEVKKAWSTRLTSAFSGVCSGLWALFPPRSG